MAKVVWHGDAYKRQLDGQVRDALAKSAVLAQRSIRRHLNRRASNRGSGGESSPPGQPPARATGMLGRSIQMDTANLRARVPSVRVGTNIKYGRIHEFGGVITKKGKALAVPIGVEGRRAARDAGEAGLKSLNLTMIKRRGKPPLLVREVGGKRSRRTQILFVLMSSVRIPKRPYMRPGFSKVRPKIRGLLEGALNGAARKL